ncbi:MAG: hypothetical protein IJ996_01280 [Clostridia bacterium]|nr:hypothetical protein [Clostridia bacterium]
MKKITSIALATCMVGSIFAFSACGNGSVNGAVKGDYTEVTAENQEQVMTDIQAFETNVAANGGMMGDMTKEDWSFGVSLAMGLDISYDMGIADAPNNGKLGLSGDVGIKLYKESAEALGLKGSGSIKVSTNTEEFGLTGTVNTDYTMKANMYITDGWMYMDATQKGTMEGEEIPEEEQEAYTKMPVETIFSMMEDLVPVPEGDATSLGIADLVATLQESGLGISYELSEKSGLKIKASVSDEMLMELFGSMMGETSETTLTMSMMAPTVAEDFALDLYVVINEKGMLEQVSLDADVEITIPNGTETPANIKVSGGVVLKMGGNVKVSIPDGLAEDTKYQAEQ